MTYDSYGMESLYPKKAILDISGGTACYLQTIIQYVNAQGTFILRFIETPECETKIFY